MHSLSQNSHFGLSFKNLTPACSWDSDYINFHPSCFSDYGALFFMDITFNLTQIIKGFSTLSKRLFLLLSLEKSAGQKWAVCWPGGGRWCQSAAHCRRPCIAPWWTSLPAAVSPSYPASLFLPPPPNPATATQPSDHSACLIIVSIIRLTCLINIPFFKSVNLPNQCPHHEVC